MELILKFKNYLLSGKNGTSAVTVKNYLADVKHFIRWIESSQQKTFTASSITIQTINEFKKERSQNLSASSVDRHISSLRKFFTFLKLNGDISHSPFEQTTSDQRSATDPWHLHDFKNFLYVYNASNLTIKNYIIDVKQFLSWAEEVLGVKNAWQVADKDVLKQIDNNLVEEYKQRLLREHVFSPASINRKLSSLRKYLGWAGENNLLSQGSGNSRGGARSGSPTAGVPLWVDVGLSSDRTPDKNPHSTPHPNPLPKGEGDQGKITKYSNIPPIRLFQKIKKVGTLGFDVLLTYPIAHLFRKVEHTHWTLRGKPIFKDLRKIARGGARSGSPTAGVPLWVDVGLSSDRTPGRSALGKWKVKVNNISKAFFAPHAVSIKDFPWYKKAIYHIRYTRPHWYHRYHQLAIAHYFNWAVLIIFATAIGFGMYNNFVAKPGKSLAALPTQPIRVLSFQGRLTDANDNPITIPSNIRFIIYNTQSSSSSARLWEEVDKVTPDQNGIFSLLLGSDGLSDGLAAALCNSGNPPTSPATGPCGIPSSLFSQNAALWLGVTVEATAELTPREQLATVAFASNSETLQGLPPITAAGAGTNNVVLALNSSGNLSIGASTTFQSTSGQFTLSGNTLALNTNTGTNGNITLYPDGQGFITLNRPLQTTTNNSNISTIPNSVEVDSLFGILATSSGQSALTIVQNGAGPIISASHSGTAEFTVDNSGNTTVNGNLTANGTQITDSNYAGNNAVFYAAPSTGLFTTATTSSVNQCLISGSSTPSWKSCALNGYWQLNGPVLSPADLNNDLAVGGNSTASAAFQVFALSDSSNPGPAGTASSSGYFSHQGTAGSQTVFKDQLLNGSNYGFYPSVGGDAGVGTPALYIQNNGNIGIGTNVPSNLLDVRGSGGIYQTSTGRNLLELYNTDAAAINNTIGISFAANKTNGVPTNVASISAFLTSINSTTWGSALTFATVLSGAQPTERMRIDTNGRVGIGSTAPVAVLDVNGSGAPLGGSLSPLLKLSNTNSPVTNAASSIEFTALRTGLISANLASIAAVMTDTSSNYQGALIFSTNNAANPTERLRITGTGNVGINTTAPSALLDIRGINGMDSVTGIGTLPTASISGQTTFATEIVDNKGFGDLFTASTSGLTKFTILNSGSIQDSNYTTADGVLFADGNGLFTQTAQGAVHTFLRGNGAGAPTFNAIDLSSADVTNILPIARGGTNGSATPTNGQVAYGNGSAYAFTTSGATGQCLTFNSGSAPTWNTCTSGTAGSWWNLDSVNGVLYPINSTVDLLVGGTATSSSKFAVTGMAGSLTPAASISATVSSGGNGSGVVIGGDGSIQSLESKNLTIGGSTTGDIILKPANGGTNGHLEITALSTGVLHSDVSGFITSSTVNLANGSSDITNTLSTTNGGTGLATGAYTAGDMTYYNSGTALTRFGIGSVNQILTSSGSVPQWSSNIIIPGNLTVNGSLIADLIPSGNGTINLGSSSHFYNTVYADSFSSPVGNGVEGFWTVAANTNLYPSNQADDLLVGGTATNSAAFQIFAQSVSPIVAGTASTSGYLTFKDASGTNPLINILNGNSLIFKVSPGGDSGTGYVSALTIAPNGNLTTIGPVTTLSGTNPVITATGTNTLTINSGATANIDFFNTSNFITNGGSLTLAGTITLPNATVLTGQTGFLQVSGGIEFAGASSYKIDQNGNATLNTVVPTADGVGTIGTSALAWSNVYSKNLTLPITGGLGGFWQLSSGATTYGVLAPTNVQNDLSVGGAATSSATFQVFGQQFVTDSAINSGNILSGTATSSANHVFRAASGSNIGIQYLNGSNFVIWKSPGGDKGLSAILTLDNGGNATLANNLAVNGNSLTTTSTTFNLLNATATTINFGAGATTALNIGASTTPTNLKGNITLGTSATNTITATGDFNSSLIPLTTDLYNLGSDPTAGGQEWNNLYVRQIITPATGGIAGYWQLNLGALAPANLTNDVLVGGSATSSALFHVYGGSGTQGTQAVASVSAHTSYAGLVADNTVGDLFTASTSGLNKFVINHAGDVGIGTSNPTSLLAIVSSDITNTVASISATQETSGNILSILASNPSTNLTGGLINVSSPNHTYMNLTNQDLTLGGHKLLNSLTNVKKVLVYDTTKDSDGGAWTNDERASAASWYNEGASATRGSTKAFPRKAIIVLTGNNQGALNIYDAKDNSLWMRFDKGAAAVEQMVGQQANSVASSAAALNGKIYVANSGSKGSIYVIDFKQDTSYRYDSGGYYTGNQTIQNRNSTETFTLYQSLTPALTSSNVNDISVNIINGQTYMAAATAGGASGAVTLINESNESLVANYGPNANAAQVWLTSTGDLYATIGNAAGTAASNYALKVKHTIANNITTSANQLFDNVYGTINTQTNYGATTVDNNTFNSLSLTPGPASTSATFVPSSLFVTQGTSNVDGKSNTIYLGALGGDTAPGGSLMVLQENQASPSAGSMKYYTKDYIGESMVGDVRAMLPFAGTGSVPSSGLLAAPDSDISLKATGFTTKTATITRSSGVRGKALTFNGTSDYLCTASVANTCANASVLDVANNNFSISFWIKTNSTSKVIVNKQATPTTSAGYAIQLTSTGNLQTILTDGTAAHNPGGTANGIQSVRTINDNAWHHIVVVSSRPVDFTAASGTNIVTLTQYIDGQLDGQGTSTTLTSTTNTNFVTLMANSAGTAANFVTGSLDEFMFTETPLTTSEVTSMYQIGYRALQNHGTPTIRGVALAADTQQKLQGGTNNVTAVAASMQNGQIYVGNSLGAVSVVGMDSDTLTDFYSSNISTVDDNGTAFTTNTNAFNAVNSISLGQSYGSGMIIAFGANTNSAGAGNGGAWMESQDTTLKDFFATNYNPFGTTLDQSNLNVDTMLRVTNQISTRLDNMAFNATSSAMLADAFRVDNYGNFLSRSLINSTTAMQFQNAAGTDVVNIDTTGLGNASLIVNNPGSGGDIFDASASGMTQFQLTNGGVVIARKFSDLDNQNYYIDPAAAPGNTGLALAGNAGIGTTSAAQTLDVVGDMEVGKDATAWGANFTGYLKRRQININNTSGQALISYQVRIVLDTASLITNGKMANTCNDIRFADTDGNTNLNFWMESGCNSGATIFWVNVPSIPGPTKTIYAYYNNAAASNASSDTNTFIDKVTNVQAAYRLDEPTYDPINDFSGNNNTATASGTSVVPGLFGNARSFNGTFTDFIAASDSASLRIASSMSLSAWFKTTASGVETIARKDTAAAGTRTVWSLDLDNPSCTGTKAGLVQATYYNGATAYCATSSTTYNDGNWHYAVTSIASNTIYLSVDNKAEKSLAITSVAAPTGELDIGAAGPSSAGSARSQFFTGTIDETRIYNASMSAIQMNEAYGAGGGTYGYVTQSAPNTEYLRKFVFPEPNIPTLGQEQSSLQTIPSFYVQNTTGNVGLGTISLASTSAKLTVAGDIKSGLYDPTTWGSSFAGWSYRARITIDNTNSASSSANANYPVQVTVNTQAPVSLGKMRSDCADVKFSDADGSTSLSFWRESSCNTTSTIFWVKVPLLPPAQKKSIYMYYGNSSNTTDGSTTGIFVRTIAGVQGAWNFDETSNTTSVLDTSGNGYNGTATGTTVVGGVFNNARFFNGSGSSDKISIPSTSTALAITTGGLSVSAWVNASSLANGGIFEKTVGNAINTQYSLFVTSTQVIWRTVTSGPTLHDTVSNAALPTGKWEHIVGVWDGGNALGGGAGKTYLYINGVLQTSTLTVASPLNSGAAGEALIGSLEGTFHFFGSIDDLKVYSTALSGAQVGDLYAAGNYPGAYFDYSTANSANNAYLRPFQNPEPATSLDTEQDPSQVDPTLYVNNTFGRVGIGTANPMALLDIEGNNIIGDSTTINAQNGIGIQVGNVVNSPLNTSNGSLYGIVSQPQYNGTTNLGGSMYGLVTNPQNINIGVILNAIGLFSRVDNTNSQGDIFNAFGIYVAAPINNGTITNTYALVTAPNSGNVGIGTTTPATTLEVSGGGSAFENARFTRSLDPGITINSTSASDYKGTLNFDQSGTGKWQVGVDLNNAANQNFWIYDSVATATRFYIDSTGKVGIGTTGPDNTLSVNGSADKATGGTTWGTFSDIRLKTIDGNYTSGLAQIMQLQPVMFHYKSGNPLNLPSDEQNYGFIAQDVKKVIPESVTESPTGYLQLSADPILWSMVNAIKQEQGEIASNSAIITNLNLTQTGDIVLNPATPSADFSTPHYFTLNDALGNPFSRMGAFVELVVGNLRAGGITAQEIATNSLAVATDNVSIAGQSLHDYIATIVSQMVNGQSSIVNSPVASVDQLHTGLISPLGNNRQIAIRVNNSGIEIAKDASSSAVASIDNNGNATFSGTLNSGNLAVNNDATISGTLYANTIKANSIEGLSAVVSTLSAQNITNVTNIYFATPSGTQIADNNITGSPTPGSSPSGVPGSTFNFPASSFASIASYSSYFAYVPNLNATTGIFQQGLVSLGPTSLTDTSITGTLSIGSQLMLADNSINVLGADFAIQPLRQGGVSFEGGLIAINASGDLTVNGNTTIKGNLAVGTLSPLAGNNFNVILNASEGSSQDSSASPQNDISGARNDNGPHFNVQNASGSGIFTVDQLGNLVASGAATIGKLNLNLVQPALALSDTEVVATGSAGTATIKAYQHEVTIDDPNVTTNSLIYITPVGTNPDSIGGTQTPYLERQVGGTSFSVGIPVALPQAVNFNWLIVN